MKTLGWQTFYSTLCFKTTFQFWNYLKSTITSNFYYLNYIKRDINEINSYSMLNLMIVVRSLKTKEILFTSHSSQFFILNKCIKDLCGFREKFFIALIRLFLYVYRVLQYTKTYIELYFLYDNRWWHCKNISCLEFIATSHDTNSYILLVNPWL